MATNFIITNEVFPFGVMFSFGETNDQLRKHFKNFNVNEGNYFDHEFKKGRCSQFKGGQVIVRLRQLPTTPDYKGVLSHEIFHAANYIMSYIGNKFSDDSEESYAYFIGFLTKKAYEQLKK